MANDILRDLGHRLVVGFGQAGARALAAGAKSVAVDARRVMREGDRRLNQLVRGIEQFLPALEDEPEDENDEDIKVRKAP